jgi:AraC-like DNA-binding protein
MKLINFIPEPALQSLISNFGMMCADFEAANIITSYQFPWSAQIRLNFTIEGHPLQIQKQGMEELIPLAPCSLIGPQLGGNTIYFDSKCIIVCICFYPGAFHRLTGFPVSDLVNQDLDAGSLFGKGILHVQRKLQETRDFATVKRIIEDFFLKRLQQVSASIQPFDLALADWMNNNGLFSITKVAAHSCQSIKQFERSCNQRLGINPKLFARLIRFSKAFAMAEQPTGQGWAGIAQDCGYYDQMHLIHDFKEFSGTTPGVVSKQILNSIKLIHLLETDPDAHTYDETDEGVGIPNVRYKK